MTINGYELPDKANVLGTEYKFFYNTEEEDFKMKGNNGYCEIYAKEIHINKDLLIPRENDDRIKNIYEFALKVIRHELIHAFTIESGLWENNDWARDEEMTDWIAIQFPKMMKCFEDVGALKGENRK